MATIRWIGNAIPVAQSMKLIPATVEVNDVLNAYIPTSTGRLVTYTATSTVIATIVTAFTNAINNSTFAEWQEVTAVDSTTHVTVTVDTAGVPVTIVTTHTDGGGAGTQTFVTTYVTTAAGPKFWNDGKNWSAGAAPTTSDTAELANWSGDILYGLTNATTLAQIDVRDTFTGKLGLPEYNSGGYAEYRDKYLAIGVAVVNVYGTGSRFKLNTGSGVTALNVYGTGASAETGIKTVQWLGTNTGNVVNVIKGSVAAAQRADEAAAINTLRMSWKTNQKGDADVYLGPGVTTLTTVIKSGGTLTLNSTFSTLTQTGGETYHDGTAAGGTLNVLGGTYYPRTSGTYAVVVAGSGGTLDCRQDIRSRTWTATTLRDGAVYLDPDKTVSHTTGITVQGDVKIDWGKSYSVNRTA